MACSVASARYALTLASQGLSIAHCIGFLQRCRLLSRSRSEMSSIARTMQGRSRPSTGWCRIWSLILRRSRTVNLSFPTQSSSRMVSLNSSSRQTKSTACRPWGTHKSWTYRTYSRTFRTWSENERRTRLDSSGECMVPTSWIFLQTLMMKADFLFMGLWTRWRVIEGMIVLSKTRRRIPWRSLSSQSFIVLNNIRKDPMIMIRICTRNKRIIKISPQKQEQQGESCLRIQPSLGTSNRLR